MLFMNASFLQHGGSKNDCTLKRTDEKATQYITTVILCSSSIILTYHFKFNLRIRIEHSSKCGVLGRSFQCWLDAGSRKQWYRRE